MTSDEPSSGRMTPLGTQKQGDDGEWRSEFVVKVEDDKHTSFIQDNSPVFMLYYRFDHWYRKDVIHKMK